MKRREFITLLGSAAIVWPLAARGQQPGKLPHIGVLVSASPPHPFADAFWRGLQVLGYSEGKNIKVEFRYTEGRSDRAEEFAEELVRLGVDVIVAHFVPAVEAAMGATRTRADLPKFAAGTADKGYSRGSQSRLGRFRC
jgi:putative ABC transport system substrate-binding protein